MPKPALCQPLQDVLFGCPAFGFIVQRDDKAVLPVAATQHIRPTVLISSFMDRSFVGQPDEGSL